jgi:hypothetical protein
MGCLKKVSGTCSLFTAATFGDVESLVTLARIFRAWLMPVRSDGVLGIGVRLNGEIISVTRVCWCGVFDLSDVSPGDNGYTCPATSTFGYVTKGLGSFFGSE